MKTITVLSQKGGAGKTLVALSLAVSAEIDGRRSIVIDTDPQASACKWADRRESDAPYVVSAQAERLEQILAEARNHNADLAVVDTAPHAEQGAIKACRCADLIIIPCRPSIQDLDAIASSIEITKYTQKTAYVMLNAVPPNAFRIFEELHEAIPENYGLPVLNYYFSQRADFVHCAVEGKTAREYDPHGKAALEEQQLYKWVADTIFS